MYKAHLQPLFRRANFPVVEYGDASFVVDSTVSGTLRELAYVDQWKTSIDNRWFHVLLEDSSFFQFNDHTSRPSFTFFHCPLNIVSIREFLDIKGLRCCTRNINEYREEYDFYTSTAGLREHVIPIRFDYDPNGYKPGVHPLAHLHLGLENEIRICVSHKLSVVSFVFFVMRQMYPGNWEYLCSQIPLPHLKNKARSGISAHPNCFWSDIDKLELYLS